MKKTRTSILLITSLLLMTVLVKAQDTPEEETQFTIYGFGRTTFVWDDQDLGRSDLFVPANIKVGNPKNPNFFIGAKQTRIGFDVKHTLAGESLLLKLKVIFTTMPPMPTDFSVCAMLMPTIVLFWWE